MDPRPPPRGFSICKGYQGEPPGMSNALNFQNPQFLQHPLFPQPPYAMNFSHQHMYPQNVQYVVLQPQYTPFSLPPQPPPPAGAMPTPSPPSAGTVPWPPPPAGVVPFMSTSYSGTPRSVTSSDEHDIVTVDDDENAEPDRTARRLNWTEVEDLRLINAWLNSYKLNSTKKNEAQWLRVAKVYNSSTPKERRRTPKQLKPHWQQIIKKIAHFYDCWSRVEEKHSGVQSANLQLMDKTWAMYNDEALAMYREEAKHQFTSSHLWKAVWNQPKWKSYIASLNIKETKLSDSEDYISSSDEAEVVPEKEIGEQESMPAKREQEVNGKVSSSSKLQEDIQCSVDHQNILEKNHEDMIGVNVQCSKQKLDLISSNQLEMKDTQLGTSEKRTDLLGAVTSRFHKIQHVKEEPMADTSRVNEFRNGNAVRDKMPEKQIHPKGSTSKSLEHARTVKGCVLEKETAPQGSKVPKAKQKRKGSASGSSEVQEDIKRAVDLQTMLQNDREKMSEVQLRLSKEQLELARLKQQEAKDKKETTLYEKYTELLMADTQTFNEFQNEEYQKAVKRMGAMLFGKDAM